MIDEKCKKVQVEKHLLLDEEIESLNFIGNKVYNLLDRITKESRPCEESGDKKESISLVKLLDEGPNRIARYREFAIKGLEEIEKVLFG